MQRCAETGLPQHFAGLDIECFKVAVEVTHKNQATGCGQRGSHEHRALFMTPVFFHGPHINGDEFAEIPIAARHLEGP